MAATLAAGACAASAAPEEIQVYVDDISRPGQFGVDVHNNFVPAGALPITYTGEQPAAHVYRLTPEFYYGLAPNIELGLYVLSTHTAAGDTHLDGAKVRVKFIAPHEAGNGIFWGGNLEVGDTSRRVSATPWNAELKGIVGWRSEGWLIVANANVDSSLSAHGGPTTFDLDLKLARSVSPATQVGIEAFNEFGPLDGLQRLSRNSKTLYGVVDHDFGRVDLNAGVGRGITTDADRWTVKLIVGTRFGAR
jgi:hypothetical protein